MIKSFSEDQFQALGNLIRQIFKEESVDFVRKADISHLPTKEEFYEVTSRIYKKLSDHDDEKVIIVNRVTDHEDRIVKIEEQLTN